MGYTIKGFMEVNEMISTSLPLSNCAVQSSSALSNSRVVDRPGKNPNCLSDMIVLFSKNSNR